MSWVPPELTSIKALVHQHGAVPQSSEQEVGRVLEAENRAAHRVPEGQETLGSRVHASVYQDAWERTHTTH